MKIQDFIPPALVKLKKKFFFTKVTSTYKIGRYELEITPDHGLPVFQRQFKLYDRFLPVLVSKINDKNKTIIDVGANIGDTTIAMLQKCKNSFICIEASDIFFSYLERNIHNLEDGHKNRVKIFKNIIGTGRYQGVIELSKKGTATLNIIKERESDLPIPLDNIVNDSSSVILIKVDTDGYDADVLNSSTNIISNSRPMLFWENQIYKKYQLDEYNKLYDKLELAGYEYIFIFDNYGNLLTEENDFATLKNLNDYQFSINNSNNKKTFSYPDVLAVTSDNVSIANEAIDDYKRNWIMGKTDFQNK